MTVSSYTQGARQRSSVRRSVAALVIWWQERQRLKRDTRILLELPKYLLRDLGLEHAVEPDQITPSYRYWW